MELIFSFIVIAVVIVIAFGMLFILAAPLLFMLDDIFFNGKYLGKNANKI